MPFRILVRGIYRGFPKKLIRTLGVTENKLYECLGVRYFRKTFCLIENHLEGMDLQFF